MTTEKPPVTQKPLVTRADEVTDETSQTIGMSRRVAIDANRSGATKIFMATGFAAPHTRSEPHHHGEAETAGYCISGRQRLYFGEGFTEFVEFGAGDFIYVPPWVPHIEVNDWDEPYVGIVARSPENIVVNLGSDDPAGD